MVFTHQSLALTEAEVPKTLVLVPHLDSPGGVSNYYKTLKLDANNNVSYLVINSLNPQSAPVAISRLLVKYLQLFIKLLFGGYKVVVVNPSLDEGKSFYRDLVFILITNLLGRKSVVFFRGWFEPFEEKIKLSKFKSFVFSISYARASKYIVLGEIFKKKLLGLGVPPETEFFIETTVADSHYLNELDFNKKFSTYDTEIKFLFLSRIEKEKGIYIAIEAFNQFATKYPERKSILIIAGDGRDLQEVKQYVQDNELQHIQFLGHVSADKKKKVLLDAHVMIFPSFTEGLPNVILEGMLYGMPIIARGTGGIPEVVQNDINGYVTDSYDSTVFNRFITGIACDKELYQKMAETNHEVAVKRFTSERVKERMFKIYEESGN